MEVNASVQQMAAPHKSNYLGTLANLGMGIASSVATGNPLPALHALGGVGRQSPSPSTVQSQATGGSSSGSTGSAGGGSQSGSGGGTAPQGATGTSPVAQPAQPAQFTPPPQPTSPQPQDTQQPSQQNQQQQSGPDASQGQPDLSGLGGNIGYMAAGAMLANPNLVSMLLPSYGFGSGLTGGDTGMDATA